MRVLIQNRQRKLRLNQRQIKRDLLTALRALGLKGAELSILFVSPARMRALNSRYRGINKETDVLSFPFYEPHRIPKSGEYLLGDIVINPSRALGQSKEHGLSFKEELRWLLMHGLLHLLGYDHERSKYAERKMRAKEIELLNTLQP